MTKEEMLQKLAEAYDLATEVGEDVENIMSTPIEDLDELINGKKTSMYGRNKDGLLDKSIKIGDLIEEVLNEIESEE